MPSLNSAKTVQIDESYKHCDIDFGSGCAKTVQNDEFCRHCDIVFSVFNVYVQTRVRKEPTMSFMNAFLYNIFRFFCDFGIIIESVYDAIESYDRQA